MHYTTLHFIHIHTYTGFFYYTPDVNECERNKTICGDSEEMICVNTHGSFLCVDTTTSGKFTQQYWPSVHPVAEGKGGMTEEPHPPSLHDSTGSPYIIIMVLKGLVKQSRAGGVVNAIKIKSPTIFGKLGYRLAHSRSIESEGGYGDINAVE